MKPCPLHPDAALNDEAATDEMITLGLRVMSVYRVPQDLRAGHHPDTRVWVVTSTEAWDADTPIRATVILWPCEY